MTEDQEVARLKEQVAQLTRETEARKAKAAAEEKAAQEKAYRDAVTGALEVAGVTTMARPALNHLREEGLVKRNEDGALVFIKRGTTGLEYELELDDGLAEWLRTTEEGRFFVGKREESKREASGESERKPVDSKTVAGTLLLARRRGSAPAVTTTGDTAKARISALLRRRR